MFSNNIILSGFFFFFLIIELYFLIIAIIPTVEIVIPKGIPSKEAKAEMETHPVTVEVKIS